MSEDKKARFYKAPSDYDLSSEDKVVCYCPEGYHRKGNVDVVCQKFGIPVFEDADTWIVAVKNKLNGK